METITLQPPEEKKTEPKIEKTLKTEAYEAGDFYDARQAPKTDADHTIIRANLKRKTEPEYSFEYALKSTLEREAKEIITHLGANGHELKGEPRIELLLPPALPADLPLDMLTEAYLASGENYKLLLIKGKRFYQALEGCLDKCLEEGNALENVAPAYELWEYRVQEIPEYPSQQKPDYEPGEYASDKLYSFLKKINIREVKPYSKLAAQLLASYRAEFCDGLKVGKIPDEDAKLKQAIGQLAPYHLPAQAARAFESTLKAELDLPIDLKEQVNYNLAINNYQAARNLVRNAKTTAEFRVANHLDEQRLNLADWGKYYQRCTLRNPKTLDSHIAEDEWKGNRIAKKFGLFRAKARILSKYSQASGIINELEKFNETTKINYLLDRVASRLADIYINNSREQIKNLYGEVSRLSENSPGKFDEFLGAGLAIYFKEDTPKAFLVKQAGKIENFSTANFENALYALYLCSIFA